MTYRGKVKDGGIVLEPGVELPEGAAVRIELELQAAPPGEQSAEALGEMTKLAVETGIRDLATNLDHYLYGHPKAKLPPGAGAFDSGHTDTADDRFLAEQGLGEWADMLDREDES